MSRISEDQARALAALTCAARPHGARRWDPAGVMAQLAKVAHFPLAELMMACGRAARDRSLDTPGAIGNPSAPCWTERPVERPTPPRGTRHDLCGDCGQPREICTTRPRYADDTHQYQPARRHPAGSAVAELRDIKAKATTRNQEDT